MHVSSINMTADWLVRRIRNPREGLAAEKLAMEVPRHRNSLRARAREGKYIMTCFCSPAFREVTTCNAGSTEDLRGMKLHRKHARVCTGENPPDVAQRTNCMQY